MKEPKTFVYICRDGENEELRYSIRSVMAFFPDAIIWVVGHPPKWYDGDYIKVPQSSTKYRNAYNNLAAICDSPKIPSNFILMNDDFYIIRPVDEIEYFNEGFLLNKADAYFDAYQNSLYTKKLYDTHHKLVRLGHKNPISYELHVPFPVEKWKLARAIKNEALLWRSMYGNIFEVGGKTISDVKVYGSTKMNFKNYKYKDSDFPFLSGDDTSFPLLKKEILGKLFKTRTKYEKPKS